MSKQFIIEQQQIVFMSDASINSKALTSSSASPVEVSSKFSAISYNKGIFVFEKKLELKE